MPRTVGVRSPSRSNTTPQGGAGGTFGGMPSPAGGRPGRSQVLIGDEVYLWILLFFELGGVGWARHYFRKKHGG